jgi:hypothetical protein
VAALPAPDGGQRREQQRVSLSERTGSPGLGSGRAAAIVPMADLRRLWAVERYAPTEAREDAEAEASLAEYREWVAAGRPGAVSHEEAMAELLRSR